MRSGVRASLKWLHALSACLVVVVDRNVELGPVELEIESAAMRIRKQGEIRV